MGKENLSEIIDKIAEIETTIDNTKKGLFGLEKGIIKKYFSQILNRLKNLFKKNSNGYGNTIPPQNENINQPPQNETIEIPNNCDTISEQMFQELLNIEGSQNFVATIHGKDFGETFVTGPYGMTYKHIDENGNLLSTPITFKDGERVSPSWAKENARAYYNKQAKKRKDILDKKGCKYTQNMLDALVSASCGTVKSFNNLKNFVTSHWDDKDAIYNYWLKFATTAAGNGKVMPGLVRRRKFEANWFKGIKKPFSSYPVR